MSKKVYGIDLGTTYSCISYVDEYGKPLIIPNAEGENTTPSVVYFESEDNIVVGKNAKELAEIYPDQVISTVKRTMGDNVWRAEQFGQEYTPQEISAFVLRKLAADAEVNIGDKIEDVVITVPAYFGVNQKEATKQAGEIAGLNVLQVIPEPTAAAISYGMQEEKDQVILVYDLGGGTFDITVIEIKDGAITVICTGGDHELGGKNWDETLAEYFVHTFSEEHGISVEEIIDDKETWQELLNDAEDKKRSLTQTETIIQKVTFEGDISRVEVTREKFEELTANYLEQTLIMTESVLQTAKDKGFPAIDKILMVGGSTYMPQVTAALTKHYDAEILQFDPNLSVSKGAALFGFKCATDAEIIYRIAEESGDDIEDINIATVDKELLGKVQKDYANEIGVALPSLKKLNETEIVNVTSKSFGIVVVNSDGEERVCNLIVVDDQVPTTVSREFYTFEDNQEGVRLRCMENIVRKGSDDDFFVDEEQQIGETNLTFDRLLPKGSPIRVTFELSSDGLLKLHGLDLTTNSKIETKFETESVLSDEQLAEKKAIGDRITIK